jgi:urease accessory protein
MTAFIGGFTQFFIPTHLLAVVAIALLAGQHAPRRSLLPAMFAIGLAAGSVAVASAVRETPAALVLLILAVCVASLVLIATPPPAWLASLLALAVGAALPLNAPPHEITIPAAVAAQAGLAIAALAAFAVVTFMALKAERPWQRVGVRIVGSWIAASAILALALRLVR